MEDRTGIIEGLKAGFGLEVMALKPLAGGYSEDEKYRVTGAEGTEWLLRISELSLQRRKEEEVRLMQAVVSLGIPMSKPLGLFPFEGRLFSLFSWCPGEDAARVLPELPVDRQYALGERSGQFLKLIHSIPAPAGREAWELRFGRKMDRKIRDYRSCGVSFAGDHSILEYLQENRHLLTGRPQSFQHGDFHTGNMVIDPEGNLSILDFDRWDYGDPWEEFNRIVWSAQASPAFARGQLDGYFAGRPPKAFFRLLALYIASNTLSSIPWAVPRGEQELTIMLDQVKEVLVWFQDMTDPVPAWYCFPGGSDPKACP